MRGEQAIFNLEIKKKRGLSINPDIHHSKVFSSDCKAIENLSLWLLHGNTLLIVDELQPFSQDFRSFKKNLIANALLLSVSS